jgi:hypothetical protein
MPLEEPKLLISRLRLSLRGFSQFLLFLRLLEVDAYEGSFGFLHDIKESKVFREYGNFMLKFQADLLKPKIDKGCLLERNLLRCLEKTGGKLEFGNKGYFGGWTRPQDWARHAGTSQLNSRRVEALVVDITCPACGLVIATTKERKMPLPRTNSGDLDYGQDWDAEKYSSPLSNIREHYIRENAKRQDEGVHGTLPFCARYQRIKIDYDRNVASTIAKKDAHRQRYFRALNKDKKMAEAIKLKAQPQEKTKEDLHKLARDNGF